MPSFNLLTRDWIPVLDRGGDYRELSLLEVLNQAPCISRIAGNPLEVAVLHRLLLAVAHRVSTPKDAGEWLILWQDRLGYLCRMTEYLQSHASRFDLYDESRPFAQHPGLVNLTRTPAEIVYDRSQGNNPIFLDASIVSDPQPISSAMAARCLLVAHAFGGSGTGGINPLNGNKKDTMYAGPLCARMIALLEGENLSETIMFNLAENKVAGLPAWERPLCDAPKQTRAAGLCDLYTRTTRNIRLSPSEDGENCVGLGVVMGEGTLGEEGGNDDPLIPVYLAKDKKFKAMRVDPNRALWRNSQALLVPEVSDSTRPLASIELINKLLNRGYLEDRNAIRLRTAGVAANAQGPVTEMWRDEALVFALDLFATGTGYQALAGSLESAEKEADTLRRQLYGFASRYVSEGGGAPDPKDVSRLVEEISPGLSDFWVTIGPEGERLALSPPSESEWRDRLTVARQGAFQAAINRLAPDARRMQAQFARSDAANSTTKIGRGTG